MRQWVVRDGGQVLPLVALMFVVLLLAIGLAVDLGLALVEKARLQTAADAASLAGSRALAKTGNCDPQAKDAAENYLQLNGFDTVADTWTANCLLDALNKLTIFQLTLSRESDTYFLRLLGMRTISLGAAATSQYVSRMVDIIISVDTTGSMEEMVSGVRKIDALREAAKDMVLDFDMNASEASSLRTGLVRFDGELCYADGTLWQWEVDVDPGDNQYPVSCIDDSETLQPLTRVQGQIVSQIEGLATVGGSGTKGGAGITGTDAAFDWTGSRPEAIRFLVLMTDGQNAVEWREWRKAMVEEWHNGGGHPASTEDLNSHSIAAAAALRAKGVEIFTIGFELNGTTSCPADYLPGDLSSSDQYLIDMSSSSTNTCDHYYAATVGTIGDTFSEIGRQIGGNRLIL